MKRVFAGLCAAVALATNVAAEQYQIGDVQVDDPVVFATPKTARAGGGFMTLTNGGDAADTLLEVKADYPRVEIHTTEMDGDVAKMVNIGTLDLPAGETVMLQPGGLHIMFMGLPAPFVEGETVPATLVFENAGEVEIEFQVVKRPAMAGMNHGGHGMSNDDS